MGNVCGAAKASRKGTIEGEDFHSIYSPLQTREEEVREADVVDVMIKDSDFSHISPSPKQPWELAGYLDEEEITTAIVIRCADELVSKCSQISDWSPVSLCNFISDITPSEYSSFERHLFICRLVVRWLCDNIIQLWCRSGSSFSAPRSVEEIIQNKKATKSELLELFCYLLNNLGIETNIVNGWTRENEIKDYSPNHTWTTVKLDGKWYLLDLLRCCGYRHLESSEENNMTEYTTGFDTTYFLVHPDQFIYSHFPSDEQWQLKRQPISLEEFMRSARFERAYFSLGVQVDAQYQKYCIECEASLSISFNLNDEEIALIADLTLLTQSNYPKELGAKRFTFSRKDLPANSVIVDCAFPVVGTYELNIYGGRKDMEYGGYLLHKLIEYRIICRDAIPQRYLSVDRCCLGFPKLYQSFDPTQETIVEPSTSYFMYHKEVTFKIWSKRAQSMILVNGKNWFKMEKILSENGALFTLELPMGISRNGTRIYSMQKSSNSYTPIVEYLNSEDDPIQISSNCFKYDVRIGNTEIFKECAVIHLVIPNNIEIDLSLMISKSTGETPVGNNNIHVKRGEGDNVDIYIAFPKKAAYILDCVAKESYGRVFKPLFTCRLNCELAPNLATDRFNCCPISYSFNRELDSLISPVMLTCEYGVEQRFTLRSSKTQRMVIESGDQWFDFYCEDERDVFSVSLILHQSPVRIYALREGENRFQLLLIYPSETFCESNYGEEAFIRGLKIERCLFLPRVNSELDQHHYCLEYSVNESESIARGELFINVIHVQDDRMIETVFHQKVPTKANNNSRTTYQVHILFEKSDTLYQIVLFARSQETGEPSELVYRKEIMLKAGLDKIFDRDEQQYYVMALPENKYTHDVYLESPIERQALWLKDTPFAIQCSDSLNPLMIIIHNGHQWIKIKPNSPKKDLDMESHPIRFERTVALEKGNIRIYGVTKEGIHCLLEWIVEKNYTVSMSQLCLANDIYVTGKHSLRGNCFVLKLHVPQSFSLLPTLVKCVRVRDDVQNQEKEIEIPNSCLARRLDDKTEILAIIPQNVSSQYQIVVHVKQTLNCSSDTFMYGLSFSIPEELQANTSNKGYSIPAHSSFPTLLADWTDNLDNYLYEPLEGVLRVGQTYKFKILVPGAVHVIVGIPGDYTELKNVTKRTNSNYLFEGRVTISTTDRISVLARYSKDAPYKYLMQYSTRS